MCHRHIFRILSQNLEYVETFCNDDKNLFLFAFREWIRKKLIKLISSLESVLRN